MSTDYTSDAAAVAPLSPELRGVLLLLCLAGPDPWPASFVFSPHPLLEQKELSLEKLSTIERFTLWKGRIV